MYTRNKVSIVCSVGRLWVTLFRLASTVNWVAGKFGIGFLFIYYFAFNFHLFAVYFSFGFYICTHTYKTIGAFHLQWRLSLGSLDSHSVSCAFPTCIVCSFYLKFLSYFCQACPKLIEHTSHLKLDCFCLLLLSRDLFAKNIFFYRFWVEIVHYVFCYLQKWMRVEIWCLFVRIQFSLVIWVGFRSFPWGNGKTCDMGTKFFNVQERLSLCLRKLYWLGFLSNYFSCIYHY